MASEADSVPHVRVVSLKYPDAKNCQASPETEQRLQRKRRSARMPRWELRIVRCFDGSCSKKSFDTSCPREWANRLKFVKEKKKKVELRILHVSASAFAMKCLASRR